MNGKLVVSYFRRNTEAGTQFFGRGKLKLDDGLFEIAWVKYGDGSIT